MLVKSKVKYIQSLSHKKQRDADSVFIAEGPKIINELLTAGFGLVELFVVPESTHLFRPLFGGEVTETDPASLEKMSMLSTPNQALALFHKPVPVDMGYAGKITLLLDGIQDPGNLGTIIRCADWFGVGQIVCTGHGADPFGPKTIQSTMGSIARVTVADMEVEQLWSEIGDISVYAAALAGKNILEMKPLSEGILVIGNESKGIRDEIMTRATQKITIPRRGGAESLNAAVATGILLSHLVR